VTGGLKGSHDCGVAPEENLAIEKRVAILHDCEGNIDATGAVREADDVHPEESLCGVLQRYATRSDTLSITSASTFTGSTIVGYGSCEDKCKAGESSNRKKATMPRSGNNRLWLVSVRSVCVSNARCNARVAAGCELVLNGGVDRVDLWHVQTVGNRRTDHAVCHAGDESAIVWRWFSEMMLFDLAGCVLDDVHSAAMRNVWRGCEISYHLEV
jgi:hypothetical protein